MPYQNDAMTLADIVSPAYAAQQMGIQNDAANQEQQMKNQVYQAQMPALEQQEGLNNLYKQAQTGYEQGLGMSSQASGLQALAAAPSGAQAMISGNQLKMSQDQSQKLATIGQMTGQLASVMDQIPVPARPAYMQKFLADKGITDPGIIQAVGDGDPDKLRNISQQMIQSSGEYQTKMGLTELQGQNQAQVAGIEANSREQVASTQADARRYAADQKARVDQLKQTTDQALSQIVTRLGTPQEQPGDRERAQFLQQQSLQLRQLQALNNQQLLGMGLPQVNVDTIPQAGGLGGGAPAQGVDAVNTLAQQQDPQGFASGKYIYRVDANGNLQRKAK